MDANLHDMAKLKPPLHSSVLVSLTVLSGLTKTIVEIADHHLSFCLLVLSLPAWWNPFSLAQSVLMLILLAEISCLDCSNTW